MMNVPNKKKYAVAISPAPVLNVPDYRTVFGGADGRTLHTDGTGLIREVEFIALPRTRFVVEDVVKIGDSTVYKVTTNEYFSSPGTGYYVDSRFVKLLVTDPGDRFKKLPSKDEIIRALLSAEGSMYIWGGNYRKGIPELSLYYPPAVPLISEMRKMWILQGVDCSGLLYEATKGYTPRNTSDLMLFGVPVAIEGLGVNDIIEAVKPLDIIVWKGHVIIILDKDRTIESKQDHDKDVPGNQGGVRIKELRSVLRDIMSVRVPVNDPSERKKTDDKKFVIRRWFAE